jgi:hypothetical protein
MHVRMPSMHTLKLGHGNKCITYFALSSSHGTFFVEGCSDVGDDTGPSVHMRLSDLA